MQFFGNLAKSDVGALLEGWRPLLRGILDPPLFRKLSLLARPLLNPGYAPANFSRFCFLTLPYLEVLVYVTSLHDV